MTLKDYLAELQLLVDQDPKILDLQLVTSSDDEGNSFHPVYYTPTLGYFNLEDRDFDPNDPHYNAICLN